MSTANTTKSHRMKGQMPLKTNSSGTSLPATPFTTKQLMPTGGVTIENVGDWVAAGAAAVGIGGELLDKKAIAEGRFEILTEKAT